MIRQIQGLYKEILETDDLSTFSIQELHEVLKHESLLERFAYRKVSGMTNRKDFIKLKGAKGQVAHDEAANKIETRNPHIGFKCLHYSVAESSGQVDITVQKHQTQNDLLIGYRTVTGTAMSPKDFTHVDNNNKLLKKKEQEFVISVPIVDDSEWNPDLDFFVELYDPATGQRFIGEDTITKVTILDEDFPGTIGFGSTDIRVATNHEYVEIKLVRNDGADGNISCMYETEPLHDGGAIQNA